MPAMPGAWKEVLVQLLRPWLLLLLLLLLPEALGQDTAASGTGSEGDPWLFDAPQGSFDDGSGPLGTYANNMDGWWLISPCEASTATGSPCTVLIWFELFDTEENYDKVIAFNGFDSRDELGQFHGVRPRTVARTAHSHFFELHCKPITCQLLGGGRAQRAGAEQFAGTLGPIQLGLVQILPRVDDQLQSTPLHDPT